MTTILIADDEPLICEFLADALIGKGYRVLTVGDGLAAFEQIARECPALIITDNMMPRLSGTALIARIHAAPMHTQPVLLMSAVAPQPPAMVPFLAKPFDVGHLCTMVHQLVGTP